MSHLNSCNTNFEQWAGNAALSASVIRRNSSSILCALALVSFVHGAGAQNTFQGTGAGSTITSGTNDSGFGYASLFFDTSGSDNTAVGFRSLTLYTTGHDNTATGSYALYGNLSDVGTGSFNTAGGSHALYSNATASSNTAFGYSALQANTNGAANTASGANALFSNTTGSYNTASGDNALKNNTTGNSNTANGQNALFTNTTGSNNTASGDSALAFNTTGANNTAAGVQALFSNTTGNSNLANGYKALFSNTTGNYNMATGPNALYANITGIYNMANGSNALVNNTTGNYNVAEGLNSLYSNTTGSNNIAIGTTAGGDLTTGSGNIDIGNRGVAAESNTTRIGFAQSKTFVAGIRNTVVAGGVEVFVSASGQLGVNPSSKRFKQDIAPMDKKSEAILALHPVTFRYKEELDSSKTAQFGLIAEEVAKVNPDLVARDDQGEIYSVRYEAVNAMLLNEFLKEHRTVEELQAAAIKQENLSDKREKDFQTRIAEQEKKIDALTEALRKQAAKIEKVSAQLALQKSVAPAVADNR